MPNSIVVIGSSNTDLIVSVPNIPRPGETVIGGQFSSAGGGKGANQAVAAARAGGNVSFIARIGNDMYGDKAIRDIASAGVGTDRIIRDPNAPSGVALICVDRNGENSIAVAPGSNGQLSSEDIVSAKDIITGADILLMQLEIPLDVVIKASEIASQAGITTILNPAPAQTLPDNLLHMTTFITPNEHEAETLTGIAVHDDASAALAAQVLMDRGVGSVLITMGAIGVYCACASYNGLIPAFRVEAIDTTAAGDVFNGVLAVGLAEAMSIENAARQANAAAAISVTKPGAQPSAPAINAIHEFLLSNQDRT